MATFISISCIANRWLTAKPSIYTFLWCLLIFQTTGVYGQDNCSRILEGLSSNDGPAPTSTKPPVKVLPFPRPNNVEDYVKLLKTRFCIKSYPWPARLPNGKIPFAGNGDAYNPLRVLTSAQMRAQRTRVNAALPSPTATNLGRQGRLYGDYLYVRLLEQEGKYEEVVAEAVRIRRQSYWWPDYLNRTANDAAEEHTYFHPASLQKFIDQLDMAAHSHLIGNARSVEQRRNVLQSIIKVHENPKAFAAANALSGSTDAGLAQSAESLIELVQEIAQATASERMNLLQSYPEILGSATTEEYLDLYLGSKKLNLIRVNRANNAAEVYAEAEAATLYRQHCSHVLQQYSSPAYNLVEVVPRGKSVRLGSAEERIDLTEQQVQAVLAGQALPEAHPLSVRLQENKPFIVWCNPLMQRSTGPLANVERFCYGLQRAYPEASIIRDDFDPKSTPQKAQKLAQASLYPDNIYVVLDKSGKIDDANLIANIRSELAEAGIQLIEYKEGAQWQFGGNKGIIVITGHVNEDLVAFVHQLGQAGYFRDNLVLVNSCETPISTQLIADINAMYGATATHRFEGLIPAADVEAFMATLAENVKPSQPIPFEKLIKKLSTQAKLRGLWVLCQLISSANDEPNGTQF